MPLPPTFVTSHLVEVEEQKVVRVLDTLRRWDERNKGHQAEKRRQRRSHFETQVVVAAHLPIRKGEATPLLVSFLVWTRDLSPTGVNFIVSREASPRVADDRAVILRLDELLKAGSRLWIGVQLQAADPTWILGDVAWTRPTHEGLLNSGVQLHQRVRIPGDTEPIE